MLEENSVKLSQSLSKGQRRNVFALVLVVPYNAQRPALLEAGALCLDDLTMPRGQSCWRLGLDEISYYNRTLCHAQRPVLLEAGACSINNLTTAYISLQLSEASLARGRSLMNSLTSD